MNGCVVLSCWLGLNHDRAPELDAVLQMGSHENEVQGENHLPQPAGHNSFDAAQDMTVTGIPPFL